MKKFSLLVALALLITVSGVYATWTYTQSTDVMDESVHMTLNLSNVTAVGTYGTYEILDDNVILTVDPKQGTTHVTGLFITGDLVVKFTPALYAPESVKENAVPTTYEFSLTNDSWTFDDGEGAENIITLAHTGDHDAVWTPAGDGTFTFTITAEELAQHILLTEFTLDTKTKYDAFNVALGKGQINFAVSDNYVAP